MVLPTRAPVAGHDYAGGDGLLALGGDLEIPGNRTTARIALLATFIKHQTFCQTRDGLNVALDPANCSSIDHLRAPAPRVACLSADLPGRR